MFKKISIRWRLTLFSALLLSICCIGLTLILNSSALNLADKVDAALITTPATVVSGVPAQPVEDSTTPSINLTEAKRAFSIKSALLLLAFILGGSALTFFVSGNALKPLDDFTKKVRTVTVNSLSETLEMPQTKDEIAELTLSFNEMTEKLGGAFEAQKRFSASAAHELRTPLAVLQTKLDVFKKAPAHSGEEYAAILSVFEKQIVRLRALVGNLLEMAAADEIGEKSELSLRDIFEDITAELSGIAKNAGVSLTLSCGDETVFGNLDLLYRAFFNLVENGIKYNKASGNVCISVCKNADGATCVIISDSGIGIDKAAAAHIFEPFYRVDKSRSREMGGAGLGLAIVQNAIELHGGRITLKENEMGGCEFKVEL